MFELNITIFLWWRHALWLVAYTDIGSTVHWGDMVLRLLRFIGTVVFLLSFTNTSVAQDVLPVGVSIFPPFKYMEDGKHVGSDTEIVVSVLNQMGYKAEISAHPWKRIQAEALAGKYALIYSLTKNKEREQYFYFSNPVSAIRDVFFKRLDSDIKWNTLEDLQHLMVSASEGYNYDESFNQAARNNRFKVNWVLGDQPESTHLKLLQAGRVDVAICEVNVCQFLLRTRPNEFNNIDFINQSIGPARTFHVGFSKQWPNSDKLVEQFNKTLGEFIATGKRDEILTRYGIELPP